MSPHLQANLSWLAIFVGNGGFHFFFLFTIMFFEDYRIKFNQWLLFFGYLECLKYLFLLENIFVIFFFREELLQFIL